MKTKTILSIVTFIATFAFIICVVDPAIVEWILDIAKPPADWFGIIKLITWAVVLFFGIGLTFIISLLVTLIVATIFE